MPKKTETTNEVTPEVTEEVIETPEEVTSKDVHIPHEQQRADIGGGYLVCETCGEQIP